MLLYSRIQFILLYNDNWLLDFKFVSILQTGKIVKVYLF